MAAASFVRGEIARVTEAALLADEDRLAIEEPLEIRLGNLPIAVTMRTPGHDQELAAGFLFTEGVVRGSHEIEAVTGPGRELRNIVHVKLRRGARVDRSRLKRHFFASSSCGICGKTTLQAIRVRTQPLASRFRVSLDLLYSLPERLREEQEIFEETGGLHAAALFDGEGNLLYAREDVGRHNALDKLIGALARSGADPASGFVAMTSRCSFELVQKAAAAGIPHLATISAPTALALTLAGQAGIGLAVASHEGIVFFG